jgi:membrane protein YdbS with pleckstrin-like domain
MTLINKKLKGAIYFLSESIQALMVYTLAISATWLWLPYANLWKWILTTMIILNFYNIVRHFIYVRYLLWKENLETTNYKLEKP